MRISSMSYKKKMKKYTIIRRQNWTQKQSKILERLAKSNKFTGQHKWESISQTLDTKYQIYRNAQQCKQRWQKFLNPKINRQEWSQQQIKQILYLHIQYGNRWKQISNKFKARTDNDVKNKFYCAVRKGLRRMYKMVTKENGTNIIEQLKCYQISHFLIGLQPNVKHLHYYLLAEFSSQINEEFKYDKFSHEESSAIKNLMLLATGQYARLNHSQFGKQSTSPEKTIKNLDSFIQQQSHPFQHALTLTFNPKTDQKAISPPISTQTPNITTLHSTQKQQFFSTKHKIFDNIFKQNYNNIQQLQSICQLNIEDLFHQFKNNENQLTNKQFIQNTNQVNSGRDSLQEDNQMGIFDDVFNFD